jgi:predicted amidophosphoribosyltransferase
MNINEQKIYGNWRAGWALDLHTISSILIKEGQYDTTRTELGEMLYQLKYHNDRTKLDPIADVASDFLKRRLVFPYLSAIIPVPASRERVYQPVTQLAAAIGEKSGLQVSLDYIIKIKKTEALKEITDKESREKELGGAFKVADLRFAGRMVLLFDDLYRSGETLKEITRVLMEEGQVSKVFVLTITKTRRKR